jgi:hypothetical protein
MLFTLLFLSKQLLYVMYTYADGPAVFFGTLLYFILSSRLKSHGEILHASISSIQAKTDMLCCILKGKQLLLCLPVLGRYAPPHPAAIWPLSANILDPVRLSLVVDGPALMLEVAQWFTGNNSAELRVLRVKNRFALQRAEISDGYRDLKLFVAFTSSSGLGIIGEVQVMRILHNQGFEALLPGSFAAHKDTLPFIA